MLPTINEAIALTFRPPDWLNEAVIGALFAALGYFGKWAIDSFKERRAERAHRRAALLELADLLADSRSVYLNQNYQARRLITLLRRNHPAEATGLKGFDETFARLYPLFSDEERELQQLIRGTTMNSMRHLNEQLQAWLEQNRFFMRRDTNDPLMKQFADELRKLSEHLRQWQDKYQTWIRPDEPRRSLVYLDDEKKHGKGFPPELTPILERVINAQTS